MTEYPHCRHCIREHPKHVERHLTPCGAEGCKGNDPVDVLDVEVDQ